jgi:hypothetical protein
VFLVFFLSFTMWTMPVVQGQTSEWTYDDTDTLGHGGYYYNNIYYDSNLLIKEISVDEVTVYYPASDETIEDPLDSGFGEASHDVTEPASGQTVIVDEWYAGLADYTPENYPTWGCYKYKVQWAYYDPAGTAGAKFKPQLKS